MTGRPTRWSLPAVMVVATSLLTAPATATAAPASLTTPAPMSVVAGERVTIAGTMPPRVSRPVVLQRWTGRAWTAVRHGTTTSTGRYSFGFAAPSRAWTYRVEAPRVRRAGALLTARVSSKRRVVVVAQRGALDLPLTTTRGDAARATAGFTPARPGRPVRLQAREPGRWRTVATARQDRSGRAALQIRPSARTTYRAVTDPWKGAAGARSETRSVGLTVPLPRGEGPWVTGYYAGWFWDQMYPPEAVDMSALTHLVFGRVAPGGGSVGGRAGEVVEAAGTAHEPGLSPDGERSVEDYLVERAHDAGAKALLMLGGDGDDGAGFVTSTSDARRAAFVDHVVDYLVEHDYDGVDVDWENCLDGGSGCGEAAGSTPVSATEARRRLMALLVDVRAETARRARYADSPALITFPGYPVNINDLVDGRVDQWQADVAALVDQYNLMSYGIGTTWSGAGWRSWFSGALTGATGTTPVDISSSIAAYVEAGVPRDRLGIGIGFYGIYYGPGITGPRQDTSRNRVYEVDDVSLAYAELVRKGYLDHGTRRWDEAAQSTYRSYGSGGYVPRNDPQAHPAGFLSYEDEQSIAAKGRWVRDTGVGGTILWTLNYGWLGESGVNPQLEAVKQGFRSAEVD